MIMIYLGRLSLCILSLLDGCTQLKFAAGLTKSAFDLRSGEYYFKNSTRL